MQIIFSCVLILALDSIAQEHTHAGAQQLGTVHFASSCNQAAQGDLDRAVALLRSFEFSNAIAGFKAALRDDTTCGLAYWGIALSQWSNPFASGLKDRSQLQAGQAAVELGKRTGAKTERERDYIAAVASLFADMEGTSQHARLIAYRDRMKALAAKYPTDHEAQIFYALAIAESEDPADKTYAGRLKAGAILESLFEEEPNHPGLAHYIIHTYDVPPLAPRALAAARRYSEIAPDAPHALHMPSHTFTRLGDWQDSINSNLAAAAAARREGETAEELHASDCLVYAYLQTGQDEAAHRVLDSLPEIASRFDPAKIIGGAAGPSVGYFALAAIPPRCALEHGDWKQAASLSPSETPFPHTQAMTWFARGLGSARIGEAKQANQAADQLKQIREQLAKSGEAYWALQVQIEEAEVRAWAMLAQGRKDEALRSMESAATLEDGTEKSAVTPGPLAPAHELYGEMLLQADQPVSALAQFESTLEKEPGRFRSIYGAGQAAQLAGRHDLSQDYFRQLLRICEQADRPGRRELIQAKHNTSQTRAHILPDQEHSPAKYS
jgi:tetratricopeptide (TPR) repeat protein